MSHLVLVCVEIEMEKICVWPCGTWCLESEVAEYTHMSDDFVRVDVGDEDPEDVAARTQA